MGQELAASVPFNPETVVKGMNNDVAQCVENQEMLERWVPRAIYGTVIGLPLLTDVVAGSGLGLGSILMTVFYFFIAKFVVWGVNHAILFPIQSKRFDRANDRLKTRLSRATNVTAGPFTWTIGGPGAMVISRSGDILIADRPSGYNVLRIPAQQIADVQVKKFSQIVTDTRHAGRTTLGGFGGAMGMAYTLGGRSTSVTRSVEDYVLEIRYQTERNGEVRTAVVPGGRDHSTVEELCALIRRLEA